MPARRIDLNLFRVLDAIHVHGGVSAAARALRLTQPAVTHALNRLREHFGDPLFVRQGNRVVPTARMLQVIGDVQLHLRGLQASVQRDVPFVPKTLETTFVLGLRDVFEPFVLPPLVRRLAERAPGVRVVSRRVAAGELERDLLAGTLDMAIDRRSRVGARVASCRAMDESLVVAMRRDHPLAKQPLRRRDYQAAAHVAVSWQSQAIPLYLALHQADHERDVRVTCQSHLAAGQVAADTDLLLVLPSAYAARLAALLPLALRPLPLKLKPEPILAYWAAARGEDTAHAWLRSEVMAAIGAPSSSGRTPRRR
jgi:DNA-binding transcriptional LysR family regulator